jgi:hypothetical protein
MTADLHADRGSRQDEQGRSKRAGLKPGGRKPIGSHEAVQPPQQHQRGYVGYRHCRYGDQGQPAANDKPDGNQHGDNSQAAPEPLALRVFIDAAFRNRCLCRRLAGGSHCLGLHHDVGLTAYRMTHPEAAELE